MSDLNFTLSDITFQPDNLLRLKKIRYRLGVCLCVFVDVKGFTIAEIKLHHI